MSRHARRVITEASFAARSLGHDRICVEHVVLGMLAVDECAAAHSLNAIGVSADVVRRIIVDKVEPRGSASDEQVPFSSDVVRALSAANQDAISKNLSLIGTGPILDAIADVLEERGGALHAVLMAAGYRHPQRPTRDTGFELAAAISSGSAEIFESAPGCLAVMERRAPSSTRRGAVQLAKAFGRPILVPDWWPNDVSDSPQYGLLDFSDLTYEVVVTRSNGDLMRVTGYVLSEDQRNSPKDWLSGEWHHPEVLARVQGAVGMVGIPQQLQASICDAGLQVQFFGYRSEPEVVSAVQSLRQVEL